MKIREYKPELSRKSVDEIRREMALYRAALRPRQTWWQRNIQPCTSEDVAMIIIFILSIVTGGLIALYTMI